MLRAQWNRYFGFGMDGWKQSAEDYLGSAKALFRSMQRDGFNPKQAVPIDPDGELLGGAHRVACAIALGFESIPVAPQTQKVFAPPWDFDWFIRAGLDHDNLMRIERDWESINAVQGRRRDE